MPAALRDATAREGLFASTRWSVIRGAAESRAGSSQALEALSELCHIYWQPVYIFLRRQGIAPHDAQDFTQGFFADLIELIGLRIVERLVTLVKRASILHPSIEHFFIEKIVEIVMFLDDLSAARPIL